MSLVKPKKEKISTWKTKADKVFSLFIRKRDAENGGQCITCNKWFPYEKLDAGHFITRNCIQLRYNEQNVNAQCQSCNRYHYGEQAIYAKQIDRKYGKGVADKFIKIYQDSKSKIERFDVQFYKEIYNKYK